MTLESWRLSWGGRETERGRRVVVSVDVCAFDW